MTPDEPYLPNLWIADEGPEQDVVVSSRMRLARNIDGYHFKARQREGEDVRLVSALKDVVHAIEPRLTWVDLEQVDDVMREVLFERHVVSRESVDDQHARAVAYNTDATTSILANEEDHLRIQVFTPGLDLQRLDERVNALDERIGERLDYSFAPPYGYLTSCPTNVGTGLRVSVMLHLPAMSFRPESKGERAEPLIVKAHALAQKAGLTIRGIHGESSRAEGDFYQISNQVTLGLSPEQAIEDLGAYLPQALELERRARRILMDESPTLVEDKVWRAWAILTNARVISSSEALTHLSTVRLGVVQGLLEGVSMGALHALMVTIRPGHLQHRAGERLEPAERDVFRAQLVRDTLKSG